METTTPTIASELGLVVGRLARKIRLSDTSGLTPSQLSALASRQSRVVASRTVLEQAVADLDMRHPDAVPLPFDWGGYALRPAWIEFWENRADRLHDRFRYVRMPGGTWRAERLAP